MGREASCVISFLGQTGDAKLLLEGHELIVRGALKARIARSDILGFDAQGDTLLIETPQGRIQAELGAKEAALWSRALAKAPPTLADKLGVSADKSVFVWAAVQDPDLKTALRGALANEISQASMTLSELHLPADLEMILPRLGHLPFWGITRKGKDSAYKDDALRATLRAMGWVDTKSCSVSATMTGTRYHRHTP